MFSGRFVVFGELLSVGSGLEGMTRRQRAVTAGLNIHGVKHMSYGLFSLKEGYTGRLCIGDFIGEH